MCGGWVSAASLKTSSFIESKNVSFYWALAGSAMNSVCHRKGIVQPLCNVIKGPHCMMSSAGALWALALHGWIPKLWPNLSGMWLTEPVSEWASGWEQGGGVCTWEIKRTSNRIEFQHGNGVNGWGGPGGPKWEACEWSFQRSLLLIRGVKLLILLI